MAGEHNCRNGAEDGTQLSMSTAARLSRRRFLGAAGGAVAAFGGATLLGACGNHVARSQSAASVTKPKRGGTFRVGCTGGASSDTLNADLGVTNPDLVRAPLLYDCLVQYDENARPQLQLAEGITPNEDATRWNVRLRPGVTFHNGKPLTAEDVLYTFQRILTGPFDAAAVLSFIDLKASRAVDTLTAEIVCSRPCSVFVDMLCNNLTTSILPVGFDPKHPIGTGPFRYKAWSPGAESTFVRNENYWRGSPYVDAITVIDFADEASQVNALISGSIDAVAFAEAASMKTLESQGFATNTSPGGFWNPFTMRVDKAPFNDVRVRQAFRLAVDRVALREAVFDGYGTLGNDLFASWDPVYDDALPQRHQDLDQARYLFKKAGLAGETVQLVTAPLANGMVEAATVLAEQASSAGVKVALNQVPSTTFFGPNYLHWTFAQDVWDYNLYWPQVAVATLPTSNFNETHFDDPRTTALYEEGLKSLDPEKRKELAFEMQVIQYDTGGYIVPVIVPNLSAWSHRVHGLTFSKCGWAFNCSSFDKVWLS